MDGRAARPPGWAIWRRIASAAARLGSAAPPGQCRGGRWVGLRADDRSVALLGTQIDALKTEVRALLRADAAAQRRARPGDGAGPAAGSAGGTAEEDGRGRAMDGAGSVAPMGAAAPSAPDATG
ncbi:unnamed protein product [Prorocentrum cordatum]|uniref:Uncharacterized protein n=1 Tax=Prorocentrum cordatum TaxID=2364126 RepID=A0ABN9RSK9_9DINO|nr:unnamed protein product [Polarella glacialis]